MNPVLTLRCQIGTRAMKRMGARRRMERRAVGKGFIFLRINAKDRLALGELGNSIWAAK
jgi:hypothetical protein